MRGDVCHSIVLPVVEDISIHASTWEATKNGRRDKQLSLNFNSHLYMRGNSGESVIPAFLYKFQFTPLHERQPFLGASFSSTTKFQFTPLHERQHIDQKILPITAKFQFTPLHERQPVPIESGAFRWINFNSRLYMRGNLLTVVFQPRLSVFQFTPLHERQLDELCSQYELDISIHASTWEATGMSQRLLLKKQDFNSRLYMRGNFFQFVKITLSIYFNSRLYMRGNGQKPGFDGVSAYFNSRLYMRGNRSCCWSCG